MRIIQLHRLKPSVITLLGLFLLCFPKGGIKYHEIPITWGYFFLILTFIASALLKPMLFSKKGLYCMMALLPFQLVSLITLGINGQEHLGYTSSYLIHFFVLPVGFFLIFPCYMQEGVQTKIFWWLREGLFFVALYGLFLFAYKWMTGSFFEIPFLTVNYHDLHLLEYDKCIDRGGVFKLISTYNNGNVYGICVLMLLPLYSVLESRGWRVWVVKTSLILTLSRTIWLGLFLYELFRGSISSQSFLKKTFKMVGSLAILGIGIALLLEHFSLSSEFLLDRFLGNRIGQLDVLKSLEWFSTKPFQGIYEVIYLGVLSSFGIVGLITFLLGMSFPMMLYLVYPPRPRAIEKDATALGMMLYLLVACSDGALLLLPVMCFYWLLAFFLVTPSYKASNCAAISSTRRSRSAC